jgi:S1-C subfamily serine protease
MISTAVSSSRAPLSQAQIGAYVESRVRAATAEQRRTTRVLAGLLLVVLICLGALVVHDAGSQAEIDKLRADLGKVTGRKGPDGKPVVKVADVHTGRQLYETNKKGIFMLVADGQGFCTAFAVRPSVLATNAHCVRAAQRHGGSLHALENEGRGRVSFAVTGMKAHPGFRANDPSTITPDVGIVHISGRAARVLDVASSDDLTKMGAGDDVYMIGFPGRLMDAENPGATFLAAHIGRLTNAQGKPAGFSNAWLVQHDALTTQGTSGSPVFDARGKVIAINAGSYVQPDDANEEARASPYKYAMRIDLLKAILKP